MIAGTTPPGHGTEPGIPEPLVLYERFTANPSGTVIPSFYGGGAMSEVRVTHPLAVVEAVEDSLVDVGTRA